MKNKKNQMVIRLLPEIDLISHDAIQIYIYSNNQKTKAEVSHRKLCFDTRSGVTLLY